MRDCLYELQQAVDKHLETYAALLGLDLAQFIYDMSNHVYLGRVREDFLCGILSGLNGTPTFYINGIRYNGSWDMEPFSGCTHISYPEKPMIQLLLVSHICLSSRLRIFN
jgi:predicted methyltransferase